MSARNVTLADIAKKVKISKSAVSLALKDSPMVSEKTRKRVISVARKMGYIRNELVSSMMSSMKKSRCGNFVETIALVNGNADEYAFVNHPTLSKYCIGIRSEAKRLGYSINEFWFHDPRFTPATFSKILRTRGIRGGIILGHSLGNVFPSEFKPVWDEFYFVSVGIKTYNPTLEMVSTDHHTVTYQAAMKARELGFSRPGLVMEEYIDDLVDGRFVAGFMRAQLNFPKTDRIEPFMDSDAKEGYEKRLFDWIDKAKPDAILYLLDSTRELLAKIPADKRPQLIQLERRGYVPNWMGMEQNNDLVGMVALRRLADMLNRRSSRVGENSNIFTLVPPTWVESSSAKEKKV